jgi:arylsulfatase
MKSTDQLIIHLILIIKKSTMKKSIFLLTLLISSTITIHAQKKAISPNIVLILMDDLGYGDLSSYGALNISTPNIDQLASEGIRFTNYVSPQAVCSASRAGLLTGCYPNRIGISGAFMPNSPVGISASEITIAELLKQKNYTTAIVGKWHLGDSKEFLPLQHGFDEYFGLPYSNDMWPVDFDGKPVNETHRKARFPILSLIKNNEPYQEIRTLEDQATITGKYTDEAIKFIKKNKQHPFFLYLAHSMPHVPINASKAFRGASKQGLYGDVIQEVDNAIGQILKTLKEQGLEDNTMVIFTSDNGPWLAFGNHAGSAGGFREGKGTSFEGGQRVPFIIKWNKSIPKNKICNQLIAGIDIFPTIAEICQLKLPTNKIDGISFNAILKGDLNASPRKNFAYYYKRNSLEAVRRDSWKLVFAHPSRSDLNVLPGLNGFPGPTPENINMPYALYDLRRDPSEAYDVKELYPEIVKELNEFAKTVRTDLGDDLQNMAGQNLRSIGKITPKK